MIINILQFKFNHVGVVVITAAQLHSTKLQLRFCAGLSPSRGVSIYGGDNLWQCSQLGIRLKAVRRTIIKNYYLNHWRWHFKNCIRSSIYSWLQIKRFWLFHPNWTFWKMLLKEIYGTPFRLCFKHFW